MMVYTIDHDSVNIFSSFLTKLKVFEQKKYLNAVMTWLSKRYLSHVLYTKEVSLSENSRLISGVASFIAEVIKLSEALKEHIILSLTRSTIPALDSLGLRRSAIAALARDDGRFK